ncbi:MAG: apolipoprotein N-acyltransferase [Syntrophobacteraceae bacterium]|jgi:apolipoprotein N-acyltransferase
MASILSPVNAILLSALSGLLLTAGFPKPAMFYLSWVSLVPLLYAVQRKTGKQAFALGYICGLVHSLTCLLWVYHAIYHYGGFSPAVSFLILFLLCCIMAVYPAVFALLAQKCEFRPLLCVFGLPFAWVALEWARAHAISGFPWANLGYTQTPLNQLIQIADITGVYGLSWLVVLGNTVIFGFIRNFYRRSGVAVLCACIVCALLYGFWRSEQIGGLQNRTVALNVGVIQGNIAQNEKWDPAFEAETINTYARLSLECVKQEPVPDILVWPESAMPFFYGLDEDSSPQVDSIVRQAGKPLLFGSIGVIRVEGKAHLLNRAYLLDKDAVLVGAYAKQHLVPFGEYVPWSNILFFVHHIAVGSVDFIPGTNSGPLLFEGPPLGVLICYEAIFPQIARETVRRGAQVLMNITNDAWYGDTGGPYQHLQIARWRAIEFRVPLVRAANTGISAMFDATGQECGRLALNTRGFLTCSVHPMSYLSFYAKYGDLFAWFCFFATLCAIVFKIVHMRIIRRMSR